MNTTHNTKTKLLATAAGVAATAVRDWTDSWSVCYSEWLPRQCPAAFLAAHRMAPSPGRVRQVKGDQHGSRQPAAPASSAG